MSTIAIQTRVLSKRYGSVTAIDGLDLEIPHGAVLGLLGPNGAGKSTTFGILCGYLQPDAGEASVLDVPCNALAGS